MKFDLSTTRTRLHSLPHQSGAMAWEASVSATRLSGSNFVCLPSSPVDGLGDTLTDWLRDAGPHVALQVRMGGLWAPELVGSELTIAVLGSTPNDACQRLQRRARELSMWLDVHDEAERWISAELAWDMDLHAVPIHVALDAPELRRNCPICKDRTSAMPRFAEVARRTFTALMWTIRSRPVAQEISDEAHRLRMRVSTDGRRMPWNQESSRMETLIQKIDAVDSEVCALPYEVSIGLLGFAPIDSLVNFSGRQAILEFGVETCTVGVPRCVPLDLGVHASFGFFNGDRRMGLDRSSVRSMLRWVGALDEPSEKSEARMKEKRLSLPTAHMLFRAS